MDVGMGVGRGLEVGTGVRAGAGDGVGLGVGAGVEVGVGRAVGESRPHPRTKISPIISTAKIGPSRDCPLIPISRPQGCYPPAPDSFPLSKVFQPTYANRRLIAVRI